MQVSREVRVGWGFPSSPNSALEAQRPVSCMRRALSISTRPPTLPRGLHVPDTHRPCGLRVLLVVLLPTALTATHFQPWLVFWKTPPWASRVSSACKAQRGSVLLAPACPWAVQGAPLALLTLVAQLEGTVRNAAPAPLPPSLPLHSLCRDCRWCCRRHRRWHLHQGCECCCRACCAPCVPRLRCRAEVRARFDGTPPHASFALPVQVYDVDVNAKPKNNTDKDGKEIVTDDKMATLNNLRKLIKYVLPSAPAETNEQPGGGGSCPHCARPTPRRLPLAARVPSPS